MSDKILIPLDGSQFGEAAVSYVEEQASKLIPRRKVKAILFHVIQPPIRHLSIEYMGAIDIPYTEEELEEIKKQSIDYLEKVGEGLRSKGAIVKCEVVEGKPSEEIIKAEKRFRADLVAMSTHGRSGLSRWALGSVTDQVLRGGKLPILVVKAQEKKKRHA